MKLSNELLVEAILENVKKTKRNKNINNPHFCARLRQDGKISVVLSSIYEIDYFNIDKILKEILLKIPFDYFAYELEHSYISGGHWLFLNEFYLQKKIHPRVEEEMQRIMKDISNFSDGVFCSENGFLLTDKKVFFNKIDGYFLYTVKYQRYLKFLYQIEDWMFVYK
ncbi:hypothetical protein VD25_003364 [Escherichia coli]|nr:hypothetical protein [Escherichia coli]